MHAVPGSARTGAGGLGSKRVNTYGVFMTCIMFTLVPAHVDLLGISDDT